MVVGRRIYAIEEMKLGLLQEVATISIYLFSIVLTRYASVVSLATLAWGAGHAVDPFRGRVPLSVSSLLLRKPVVMHIMFASTKSYTTSNTTFYRDNHVLYTDMLS